MYLNYNINQIYKSLNISKKWIVSYKKDQKNILLLVKCVYKCLYKGTGVFVTECGSSYTQCAT
jgi:hypothetical protein